MFANGLMISSTASTISNTVKASFNAKGLLPLSACTTSSISSAALYRPRSPHITPTKLMEACPCTRMTPPSTHMTTARPSTAGSSTRLRASARAPLACATAYTRPAAPDTAMRPPSRYGSASVTVSGISRQHIPKSGRSSSETTDTCSLRLRDLMALRVRSWGIRGSLRPCRKSSHGSMTFDAGGIFNGRFPGFVSVAPWLRPGFVGSS